MFIKCLKVGQIGTNCYILCDKVNNRAAIIDPGFEAGRINAALLDTECTAEYIILTHAHFDHIGAVRELLETTGARLAVLDKELPLLNDPARNLQASFEGGTFEPFKPDLTLHDGNTIELGMLQIRVMHTPGHTPGSCCLICQDGIFSGDTLFKEDIGRTALPGGSLEEIKRSVAKRMTVATVPRIEVFDGGPARNSYDFHTTP